MGIYNITQIDFREKMLKCQEYVEALEEERRKITVFERELPLCLQLVSQAIEKCRQQMAGTIMDCSNNGQSDQHSEQTSNDGPVLEEFIPIKRTSDQQQNRQLSHNFEIICSKDKSFPFSVSTQLSIKAPDPPIEEDLLSNKVVAMDTNRNGYGAFHPFRKRSSSPAMVAKAATSCSADTDGDGGSKGHEDKGLYNKKERRCWSPELHRRFLHALQQLGGAHVATPKQIKELMKVNGLTNDEIKSHLQKYRLHTRRVSPTLIRHNDPHPSQLVVVGRIWMPPLEYTTSSPASNNTNNTKGVFTPIASLPPSITASLYKTKLCNQQPHMDGLIGSQSHSSSPSTSAMHTATVSTAF